MESSPLTQAHSHATRATQLISSSKTLRPSPSILKEASQEHFSAAELFSKCAADSSDSEAKRTLLLLKAHHEKLAQALEEASKTPAKMSASSAMAVPLPPTAVSQFQEEKNENEKERDAAESGNESRRRQQTGPAITHPSSLGPPRLGKSTSSLLATNLASARGIPYANSSGSGANSPHAHGAATPTGKGEIGRDAIAGLERLGRTTTGRQARTKDNDQDYFAYSGTGVNIIIPGPNRRREQTGQEKDGDNEDSAGYTASTAQFTRFYNSLEGLITKIGSPLAGPLGFTGMNLDTALDTLPEEDEDGQAQNTTSGVSETADGNYGYGVTELVNNLVPKGWWGGLQRKDDVVKIVRKGTRRASLSNPTVRKPTAASPQQHPHQQKSKGNNNINKQSDSYLIVPPTGHTLSYAAMVQQSNPSSAISVARDPSPSQRMRRAKIISSIKINSSSTGSLSPPTSPTSKDDIESITDKEYQLVNPAYAGTGNKTMEELLLENSQLRHLADTLSRRLHTWEVNAREQRALMDRSILNLKKSQLLDPSGVNLHQALAGSLYGAGTGSGAAGGSGSRPGRDKEDEERLQKRIAELESELETANNELEGVRRENEQLKEKIEQLDKVLGWHKDRWEKLKESARNRSSRRKQNVMLGIQNGEIEKNGGDQGLTVTPIAVAAVSKETGGSNQKRNEGRNDDVIRQLATTGGPSSVIEIRRTSIDSSRSSMTASPPKEGNARRVSTLGVVGMISGIMSLRSSNTNNGNSVSGSVSPPSVTRESVRGVVSRESGRRQKEEESEGDESGEEGMGLGIERGDIFS